ncbi:MAG: pseudaminic acid cytidylyltransferase [Lachnospiraceae bacterium]|nr:pseudaminic acid cytidylyltransferase [Lachnospiraceae bacterium]
MSAIAIITARGGSKRIPKKNIKEFCDKPIIAYSIEAALKSGIFDEVMVSTDSEEIAEIAEKYGAKVPFFRSSENAGDFASTADVIAEVLECYAREGKTFEYTCCIYPTAPFVTAKKLQDALQKMIDEDADSLMPVVSFSFPPQRGMVIRDGKLSYMFPENAMKRSQDLETMYHDCGQFYFLKTDEFLKEKKLVLNKATAMEMSELEVQDIDNESDWNLAELKYRLSVLKEKIWIR